MTRITIDHGARFLLAALVSQTLADLDDWKLPKVERERAANWINGPYGRWACSFLGIPWIRDKADIKSPRLFPGAVKQNEAVLCNS
jgi:hypothetical protein